MPWLSADEDTAASAVAWLCASQEPGIRRHARRVLSAHDGGVAPDDVLDGPMAAALLAGQQPDGGFGVHPYRKWTGAHWRLVSLVELGAPAGDPRLLAAARTLLDWLGDERRLERIPVVDGLARCHASMEGNALAVCSRLGMADEPRVERLARRLVDWQWPDGGWNCDPRASGRRSSFHESLVPAWGLHEFWSATGADWARDAALHTAELLLDHRLLRASATGAPIDGAWLRLRYPPYWHYDVLQALLVLARMGLAADPRAADALAVVEGKRRPDGRWAANGAWWRSPGSADSGVEVVDWGRRGPNEMITLNALRVLVAAGWAVPYMSDSTTRPRSAANAASRNHPSRFAAVSEAEVDERVVRVRRRVLRWWRTDGRDFPWRHTRDPWAVLLAELMLQRTRADLVPRVYEEAMRRYPTAGDFADAPADELAALLRPLGFVRRNARLRLAADACRDGVPRTMAGLLAVPGVGRYAATATLCFAFGRRVAVIDPSVIRLLERLELGSSARPRPREDPALWAAADAMIPARGAREWNYAVLDLAATVCRPKPRCAACPLLTVCPTGRREAAPRLARHARA